MDIWYSDSYSVPLVKDYPDHIFVFGDNLECKGRGGQACIRFEKNAFGIPTKRLPRHGMGAYFTDREDERTFLIDSLRELWKISKIQPIVFPCNGIGTGMAKMLIYSPMLYHEMCDILSSHFGIDNGSYDSDKLLGG